MSSGSHPKLSILYRDLVCGSIGLLKQIVLIGRLLRYPALIHLLHGWSALLRGYMVIVLMKVPARFLNGYWKYLRSKTTKKCRAW